MYFGDPFVWADIECVCIFAICKNCIEKNDNNCHQGGQTLILEGKGGGGLKIDVGRGRGAEDRLL